MAKDIKIIRLWPWIYYKEYPTKTEQFRIYMRVTREAKVDHTVEEVSLSRYSIQHLV